MSRQIDQEIIQATNELQEDVRLTHDIVTGDENTIIEVSPGNQVRSPKKMIEDAYAETKQESGELLNQLKMQGGRKNLLINGDFAINQRAQSQYPDTLGNYCLDRWMKWQGGYVMQVFNTSNMMHAARLVKTASSSSFYALTQPIENGMLIINGKPLVISFWIRSNRTGTLGVVLRDMSKSYSFRSAGYQIDKANTWEKKEIVFDPYITPSDSNHLIVYPIESISNLLTNDNDNIEITAVQLEIGETATEFEIVHPGTELALCQRYYCKSYRYSEKPGMADTYNGRIIHHNSMQMTSGGYYIGGSQYPVQMRAAPTVTLYSPVSGASGKVAVYSDDTDFSVNSVSEIGFVMRAEATVAADKFISMHYTASAEI